MFFFFSSKLSSWLAIWFVCEFYKQNISCLTHILNFLSISLVKKRRLIFNISVQLISLKVTSDWAHILCSSRGTLLICKVKLKRHSILNLAFKFVNTSWKNHGSQPVFRIYAQVHKKYLNEKMFLMNKVVHDVLKRKRNIIKELLRASKTITSAVTQARTKMIWK